MKMKEKIARLLFRMKTIVIKMKELIILRKTLKRSGARKKANLGQQFTFHSCNRLTQLFSAEKSGKQESLFLAENRIIQKIRIQYKANNHLTQKMER